MLRLAVLALALFLVTSTKLVPGAYADAEEGLLKISLRLSVTQRSAAKELLLIEVVSDPFATDPLRWQSSQEIAENGGTILLRIPVDSSNDVSTPLEVQENASYWLALYMKDGSLEEVKRIDESVLKKIASQRGHAGIVGLLLVGGLTVVLVCYFIARRRRGS